MKEEFEKIHKRLDEMQGLLEDLHSEVFDDDDEENDSEDDNEEEKSSS